MNMNQTNMKHGDLMILIHIYIYIHTKQVREHGTSPSFIHVI